MIQEVQPEIDDPDLPFSPSTSAPDISAANVYSDDALPDFFVKKKGPIAFRRANRKH